MARSFDSSVSCPCGSFENYVWIILDMDFYVCEFSMLHEFDSMPSSITE